MDTKNPRGDDARASVSIRADAVALNKSFPDHQALREHRVICVHRVRPTIAGLVASLAYGGGAHG